jgi:uncharacterized protein YbjT (DUF2867 family)
MKYVITGSTGHISKPLSQKLIAAGHQVSLVTSKSEKVSEIEAMGARALVGSVEDASFLETAFAGADAVYLIIPPKWNVDNWIEYQKAVANNYTSAIAKNGVKYVLSLSSVGAHMGSGCGPVDGVAYLDSKLAELKDVNVKILRPSYFFYNLFSMVGMIKGMGIMGSTQPANHSIVLTDTADIADAAFEELNALSFTGYSIRYMASDERTWTEIASVLGAAIGKPELPYVEFTDEQSQHGMTQMGLPKTIVEGYVALGAALRSGNMEAEYKANRPAKLGKVKLEDFAVAFAGAYNAA